MKRRSKVRYTLLTEFDEKKFAKAMWKEGYETGYMEGQKARYQDYILNILDEINKGNDTLEKLIALGYDAEVAKQVLKRK